MATTNDQVWIDWTDNFLSKKFPPDTAPMDKDTSGVFISLCFLESSGKSTAEMEASLEKDFLFNVLKKRADLYKLDYSIPALVFVAFLCQGRPGTAVMWVHAMVRLQQKIKDKITLHALAVAFPVGFPVESTLQQLWDAQKHIGGAADNYLDTVSPA